MDNSQWFPDSKIEQLELVFSEATTKFLKKKNEDVGEWSVIVDEHTRIILEVENECSSFRYTKADLPDDMKELSIYCLITISYCKLKWHLENNLQNPDVAEYDNDKPISSELKELEQAIRSYKLNKVTVYNNLQRAYDQWSEEWSNEGLKYSSDELQMKMLEARWKYYLFRNFPKLIPFSILVDKIWFNLTDQSARIAKVKHFDYLVRIADFLKPLLEWWLFKVGKGIITPFIWFVFIPILTFAAIYQSSDCLINETIIRPNSASTTSSPTISAPENQQLSDIPTTDFKDSLIYSIGVFTGSDTGSLKMCGGNSSMRLIVGAEALLAYILSLVVVGYLVNRLSSR